MKDFHEYIDEYVAGKLNSEDTKAFEEAMKSDEELAKVVENYQAAKDISSSLVEMDVLNKLESWDDNQSEGKTEAEERAIKRNNRISLILLSLLAAFIIGYFAYQFITTDNNTTEKTQVNPLYALGYEKPYDESTVKSAEAQEIDNLFARGKYYIAINDWENAQLTLEEAISNTDNKDSLSAMHYWLAHVFLNTQSWKKAEGEADEVTEPDQKKEIQSWLNKIK